MTRRAPGPAARDDLTCPEFEGITVITVTVASHFSCTRPVLVAFQETPPDGSHPQTIVAESPPVSTPRQSPDQTPLATAAAGSQRTRRVRGDDAPRAHGGTAGPDRQERHRHRRR